MARQVERRTFLTSAAAAAAAIGLPVMQPGTQAFAAVPQGTPDPRLSPIKHVVVLMQENRSFDHYFGTLKGVRGFSDKSVIEIRGSNTGPSNKTVFEQPKGSGTIYPWKLSANPNAWESSECHVDGGGHSWPDQHSAFNNGSMDNWYSAKSSTGMTMGYMARDDIPFNYALADAYTICDSYHCSVLSGTGPNRNYLWSGSIGAGLAGASQVSYDGGDFRRKQQNWQTYAESLQAAAISWKVYQVYDKSGSKNYGDNALEYFAPFMTSDSAQDGTGDPTLWKQGVAGVPYTNGQDVADALVNALRVDVINDTLPQVSWIVTDASNSEHPDHSPSVGANMTKRILETLNENQAVFNSTVFILTYDENDGYFDHLPPAVPADSANTTEYFNNQPIGLGFRVPMIIASPWTRGGRVNSQVFDHTSVIRLLEQWTGVNCPNISQWRRAVCGDLTSTFDFNNPVFGPLPSLPSPFPAGKQLMTDSRCAVTPAPSVPGAGSIPVQETGNKVACPLPYQPNVYLDRYEGTNANSAQKIWLNFENQGNQAVNATHFATYTNAYRAGGPWQYTVAANGSTNDFYNIGSGYGNGKYDFTVIGPNRFLRRFRGSTNTGTGRNARVKSYFAAEKDPIALWFQMFNDSITETVTFTVTSNNYRSGTWTYSVGPGTSKSDFFNQTTYSNGWYDFTITVSNDANWSQRFIGHIETGKFSVSGSTV